MKSMVSALVKTLGIAGLFFLSLTGSSPGQVAGGEPGLALEQGERVRVTTPDPDEEEAVTSPLIGEPVPVSGVKTPMTKPLRLPAKPSKPAPARSVDLRKETRAFVTSLYRIILGRDPDPNGLDFWVEQILLATDRKYAMRWVLDMFLTSPEYLAGRGKPAGNKPAAATPSRQAPERDIHGRLIPERTCPPSARLDGPISEWGAAAVDPTAASAGMPGVIKRAWQVNYEDYPNDSKGGVRRGNTVRFPLAPDEAVMFKFKTGPDGSFSPSPWPGGFNVDEHTRYGPTVPVHMVLSEKPWDFDYKAWDAGKPGHAGHGSIFANQIGFNLMPNGMPDSAAPGTGKVKMRLRPNTTYYFSIRCEDPRPANRGKKVDTGLGLMPEGKGPPTAGVLVGLQ